MTLDCESSSGKARSEEYPAQEAASISKSSMDAGDFLALMYESVPDEHRVVAANWSMKKGDTGPKKYFDVDNADERDADALAAILAGEYDKSTYLYTGTWRKLTRSDKGNLSTSESGGAVWGHMHMFVIDDVGTDVMHPVDNPNGINKVHSGDIKVEPDAMIESSPGNFQYFYRLEPTMEHDRIKAFNAAMAGHKPPLQDPGLTGSMRVVRLPLSLHASKGKDKRGRPAWRSKLTVNDCAREFLPWPLNDLIKAFEITEQEITEHMTAGRKSGPRTTIAALADGDDIDPVVNWMVANEMLYNDNGGWKIAIKCPREDWHSESDKATGARYMPIGRSEHGDDPTKTYRGFRCDHGHSNAPDEADRHKMGTEDFIKWANENQRMGFEVLVHDPITYLSGRYAFMANDGDHMYVDLQEHCSDRRKYVIPEKTFKAMHNDNAYRIPSLADPKRSVSAIDRLPAKTSPALKLLHDVWAPGEDAPFFTDKHGSNVLNTFCMEKWPRVEGEPTWLIDHLDYLLPYEGGSKLFQQWLAHKWRNPGLRSYAFLMFNTRQGVGRSFLKLLLERLQPELTKPATIEDMYGIGGGARFNDYGVGALWTVTEESHVEDGKAHRAGYTHFKAMGASGEGDKATVDSKYGKKGAVKLYFNALIFSNSSYPVHIPAKEAEGERRFYIARNPDNPRSQEYYDELFAKLHDDQAMAQVATWLAEGVDLEGYNFALPPMTAAKQHVIEESKFDNDRARDLVLEKMRAWGLWITTKDFLYKLLLDAFPHDMEKVGRWRDDIWRTLDQQPGGDHLPPETGGRKDPWRVRIGGREGQIHVLRSIPGWNGLGDVIAGEEQIEVLKRVLDGKPSLVGGKHAHTHTTPAGDDE